MTTDDGSSLEALKTTYEELKNGEYGNITTCKMIRCCLEHVDSRYLKIKETEIFDAKVKEKIGYARDQPSRVKLSDNFDYKYLRTYFNKRQQNTTSVQEYYVVKRHIYVVKSGFATGVFFCSTGKLFVKCIAPINVYILPENFFKRRYKQRNYFFEDIIENAVRHTVEGDQIISNVWNYYLYSKYKNIILLKDILENVKEERVPSPPCVDLTEEPTADVSLPQRPDSSAVLPPDETAVERPPGDTDVSDGYYTERSSIQSPELQPPSTETKREPPTPARTKYSHPGSAPRPAVRDPAWTDLATTIHRRPSRNRCSPYGTPPAMRAPRTPVPRPATARFGSCVMLVNNRPVAVPILIPEGPQQQRFLYAFYLPTQQQQAGDQAPSVDPLQQAPSDPQQAPGDPQQAPGDPQQAPGDPYGNGRPIQVGNSERKAEERVSRSSKVRWNPSKQRWTPNQPRGIEKTPKRPATSQPPRGDARPPLLAARPPARTPQTPARPTPAQTPVLRQPLPASRPHGSDPPQTPARPTAPQTRPSTEPPRIWPIASKCLDVMKRAHTYARSGELKELKESHEEVYQLSRDHYKYKLIRKFVTKHQTRRPVRETCSVCRGLIVLRECVHLKCGHFAHNECLLRKLSFSNTCYTCGSKIITNFFKRINNLLLNDTKLFLK